jgi:hypothetical protein
MFGIAGLNSGDTQPAPANSTQNVDKFDPLLPRIKRILRRKKVNNVVS